MTTPQSNDSELSMILNDYVIHGIKTSKCKDNFYKIATLKRRLDAWSRKREAAVLESLLEHIRVHDSLDGIELSRRLAELTKDTEA